MKSIHGHEVLNRMLSSAKTFARQELLNDIASSFGPDARFHTCSAENLSAVELLDFLLARGKVIERDGRIFTSPEFLCQH